MIDRSKPGMTRLSWASLELFRRGLPIAHLARGTVAAVLILLIGFYAPPWVLLDPIDRFTHLDGRARSMVPTVFAAEESRASAHAKLSASGYHHRPIDRTGYHAFERCGDLACERAVDGFTDVYRKIAVTWSIACANDFIVWLKFDEDDRLLSARNAVHSVCL